MKEFLAKVFYQPIRLFNLFNIRKRYSSQKKLKDLSKEDLGKVLIISPHSDDETIGCSGLLQNREYDLLYMTDSGASKKDHPHIITIRKKEAEKIFEKTKGKRLFFLDGENGNLEKDEEKILKKLKEIVSAYDTIFLISFWDNHPEHYMTAEFFSSLEFTGSVFLYEVSNWLPLEETTHYWPLSEKEHHEKKELLDSFRSQTSMDFDLFLMANKEKGRRQKVYSAEYFRKTSTKELREFLKKYSVEEISEFLPYRLGNHRSFYKTLRNEEKNVF